MNTVSVALVLGVSVTTVRNLANRGVLRAVRDARGWRIFDPEDVERYARAIAQAQRARRSCPFCGRRVPQRRTYCETIGCRRRRQRLRWRRWRAGHAA